MHVIVLVLFFIEVPECFPTIAQWHLFRNADLTASSEVHNADLLKTWKFYATALLPCVKAGKIPPLHHKKNLAQFHKIFTVSDEAFVMWVIFIYSPKWKKTMSLTPEERRVIKASKGATAKSGIAQLKKEDQKSFKEWYAVCQRGRESYMAVQWLEALAEWPTSTINIVLDQGQDEVVEESEDEDFPCDSWESVTAV